MLGYIGSEPGKSCIAYKKLLLVTLTIGTLLTISLSSRAQKVYATTQDNGVSGLCLLCGVSNPSNPVNNSSLTDYSTFNETVGLLGVSVYQDLIFPGVNTDVGCDSLVVGLGSGSALLSVALLGGVTIESYNGTTPNGDVTNVSTAILRLLSGAGAEGEVFFVPQKSFDRVRISLNSSLAGALTSLELYYAYTDKTVLTAPTLSGGNAVTLCSGSTAVLTASANDTAATLNWFTQPSGGTPVYTGSSYSVSPATTTTYYVESDLGSCSSPARTAVKVTVNALPVVPGLVNASLTVCSGNPATFSVMNPESGVTYNWYTVATGGTPVATGTQYTIQAATTSQNYYLEADSASSGCASPTRATAVLNVNPTPDSTMISGAASVTVNQGQTATFSVASSNPAYTYNWYDAPTGGNLVYTGTSFTTPAIYAPTSYYVSATSNQGCTAASRTMVTVNVLSSNNITCGQANQQVSPVITGVCLLCSVSNGALAVDGNNATASTLTSTIGALGSVGQTLQFPNTYPAGDSIVLDLAIPSQLVSATLLGGITVQTSLNGTANNDATTLNGSLIRLQLLGGGSQFQVIIPAQNSFNAITVSISGTVSLLSNLDIYYAAALVPRPTVASSLLNICGSGSDTLKATGPAGATFNWYSTPTGGISLATGASYVTPVLTANATYYVQSSQFGCANSVPTPVTVDVNAQPSAPTISTPSVTICSGDSATLSATVPAGDTVKWYTLATGGTAVDSGASFTTPALTDTTIYYAAATLNGCSSSTRTSAAVNVNQSPQAVTVTPAATTISAGQSASFTASSTTAGVQFNWYTQASGGAPVFTGATYSVSPSATTTYYVAAVNPATGCTTPVRTSVTVTVITGGGPAVPCGAATTETSSVNGLCIGCGVQNEALAVDGNANTGSTLSVLAGLLGGDVQQTLIFPFTANTGDSIRIKLVFPSALLSLGVLGSINVATYNGNNSNNDQQAITSSLINIDLLSGSDSAIVSFAPTKPYDRVLVTLNSGVATLLTSVNIDYAASVVPAPVLQSDTVTICSGQQATLAITAPSDATFTWYTTATGGSPVYTGATFQTPVLTDTTVYYAQSAATVNGCANTTRTPVVVNVPAPPAAPTVKSGSISVCSGSKATLIASAPAGISINWYTSSSGGASIYTGDTLVTPVLDSSTLYYAAASNSAGCTSASRTAVTVNIVATPAAPVIAPSADTLCAGGTASFAASSTTPGVQFNWYASATGDTALFMGASFTTPVLDSSATYYVTASAGSCASAVRSTATVLVNPKPAAPTVTVSPASASVNSGSTVTMTASSSTPNAIIDWYTVSTGGSPVYTGASYTTPALTSTVTYYAEAVGNNGAGCSSTTRTAVTITVIPGINLTCGIANTQTNSVSGLCIGCSVSNAGLAVDNDSTTYSTLNIGASVAGSVQQTLIFPEVSQPGDSIHVELSTPGTLLSASVLAAIQLSTADGASSNNDATALSGSAVTVNLLSGGTKALISYAPPGPYDRVTVQLNAGLVSALTGLDIYYATDQVDAPVVGTSNVTICSGTSATLTAKTSVNAAVEWFNVPTGGVALAAGDTLHTPALTQTTTFYAEALRAPDSCANLNRVPVTVSVVAGPTVPVVADNPDTICSGGDAILQASAGTNQVLWYDSATGGTLLYTGNIYTTPALTASKSYWAGSTNGTCSSTGRDSVSVIVGPVPSVPVVHPSDTTICQGLPVTLTITQPQTGVTYNWYTVLSGGTPVYTGITYITPALSAGVTYYVEAVNTASNCTAPSARTQVTVNVTPVPASPSVTAAQVSACSGQPATVSVASPQSGLTYQWYDAATGGSLLFTGPNYSLSAVTASENVFVQAAGAGGGCGSATRTEVTITADSIPAIPQVQATDVSLCSGGTATFTVTGPQTGVTYNWYDAPTGGNLLATGASFITPVLTASATYYAGAVNASGCAASARTVVNADVVGAPVTPTVALSPVVICSGGMATLQVVNPQSGIVYDWYNTAGGGTVLSEGASFTTPVLSSGTTYYVAAINATPGCSSNSARTPDSVAIGAQPAVPVLVSANNSVCAGSNVTLTIQSPQAGISYNWYASASSTTPLFVGTQYVITGDTASAVYYVQASTSGGCTSTTEATADVTVNPAPVAPTVQVPDITVCPNNTATFNITNPQPGYTYSWYATASGGTALATGASFTTPVLTSGSVNYYAGAQSAGGCNSPALTMVMATVSNNLTPPQLINSSVSACSGQPAVLTVLNPQGGITYNWYDAATGGNLVYQGTSYTLTNPAQTDTFYVASVASGGSCSSATRTQAVLTVTALPPAPSLVTSGAQVCSGGNVALQVMNPQSGTTYNWYSDASGGTPVFSGTIYTLTDVTASAEYYVEASLNGCASSTRTPVSVDISAPASAPTATASSPGVCPGDDAILTAASATSGATFSWYTTATGGTPVAGGATFTTGALTSDTTFYVSAASPQGCTDSSRTAVSVTQLLPLSAPVISVESRTSTSVTFEWAPVTNAAAYQVSLDSGATFITPSSGPTGLTETVNGLLPNQVASIEVRALGANPCQTSTASGSGAGISGNPLGDNIFVPNIFSPNGDGVNDILYVYSNAIATMDFRIYNQWGQEIFESRSVSTGWDGTAGGAKQPIGVYIYVLQATMQDGTVVNKKGSVTLIR